MTWVAANLDAEPVVVARLNEDLALIVARMTIEMPRAIRVPQLHPPAPRQLVAGERRTLDVRTAARKTGLTERLLRRLAQRGEIRAEKRSGRWVIDWSSLLAYLDRVDP